jgi:hypothetical protein
LPAHREQPLGLTAPLPSGIRMRHRRVWEASMVERMEGQRVDLGAAEAERP